MKKVVINEVDYELIKEYRDGFNLEEVSLKLTDFFDEFEYVCGDWAYGKLRLKGFYNSNNKKAKEFNDIKNLADYLKNNCAVDARYFVIKKIG